MMTDEYLTERAELAFDRIESSLTPLDLELLTEVWNQSHYDAEREVFIYHNREKGDSWTYTKLDLLRWLDSDEADSGHDDKDYDNIVLRARLAAENSRFVLVNCEASLEPYPDIPNEVANITGSIIYDRQEKATVATLHGIYAQFIVLEMANDKGGFQAFCNGLNECDPDVMASEGIPATKPEYMTISTLN